MQFLRTLFWVILTVAAIVFAYRNWFRVEVRLFGGLVADAKLPVLLFGSFLIGFVPTYVLHRTTRWRLRRRAETSERLLAELRGPEVAPVAQPGVLLEPAVVPVPPAVS